MNKIKLSRAIEAEELPAAEGDEIKRIVISSDKPVEDFGCDRKTWVILSHGPDAVDLSYVEDGVPVRYQHGGDVVARALEPKLQEGKLVSEKVVWSNGELAKKIKADVFAKILTNISVEAIYSSDDVEVLSTADTDTVTVKKWRCLSCAIVVNGADTDCRIIREIVTGAKKKDEARELYVNEIKALARQYGVEDATRDKWIDNNVTINEAKAQIARALTAPTENGKKDPTKTMKYSIIKAINGGEQELARSAELASQFKKEPKGVYIDLTRAFDSTSGAGLVHDEHRPDLYVDALYHNMVLELAGATMLDGLTGNSVSIPVSNTAVTGYWIGEDGTITGSQPETGSMVLASKTCGSMIDITHKLMTGGLPAADMIVENMIRQQLARAVQKAALQGTGVGAEPEGILTAITPTTWAATPTYAQVLALEGAIVDGVDSAGCVYVMDNAMFTTLRGVQRGTANGFVGEIIDGRQYVLDRPAYITADMPANTVLFGNFAEGLYVGDFSPIDIIVDKSTNSNKLGVRLVGGIDVGIGVLANRFSAGRVTA